MKVRSKTKFEDNLQVVDIFPKQLGTIAALDSNAFSKINVTEDIPAAWEDRARKSWQYYIEEPIVANIVDSWRALALGDELKIDCDDEDVKWEAIELADRLSLYKLLCDLIIQTMVKGSGFAYKRYAKTGDDVIQLLCLNPLSIKLIGQFGRLFPMSEKILFR